MFENHVILPSSKPTYFFKQLYELFEYHVILSSAKPTRFTSCRQCWFEYHVISSSSKLPFCGDRRSCSFEYHVIHPSKLEIHRHIEEIRFEHHVILPSSKPSKCWSLAFFRIWQNGLRHVQFENPVISFLSNPLISRSASTSRLEHHVILSSFKPPADCYTWVCVWVPCNFIFFQIRRPISLACV